MKVMIATSRNISSEGLVNYMKVQPNLRFTEWVTESTELQQKYERQTPDCLILGVTLFNEQTANQVKVFKEKNPSAKVLVITFMVSQQFVRDIMESGALGILSAPHSNYEQLLDAIYCVGSGRIYLCQESTEEMLGGLLRPEKKEVNDCVDLSKREIQIVRLIVDGHSSKEIAKLLSISPATVDVHRKNVMRKIGANKTAEIAKYAIKSELVTI